MYIEAIKIRNFRLLKDFDLKLNKGLNVLVGENDAGKTALVDAIRIVLGANSAERSYISETDFNDDETLLSIQLKFVEIDKHAHRFVEHLTHEKYKIGNEERHRSVLYVQLEAQKTLKERRGYPYIRTEIKSGIDGNGLPLETEIRDFLSTTYLKPLRDAEAELSNGRGSRLAQILNSSKEIKEDKDNILKIIADANDQLIQSGSALQLSTNKIQDDYLYNLVFESDKEVLGAHIDLAGVTNNNLSTSSDQLKRRYLRSILEGLSLNLTKNQKRHGLGYHNLLFMAAELLLLEEESDTEFPLLLIEEPEAHLHPQLQMKLLQFINSKVSTDKKLNGLQCILTTHSPNISSKADPSEVIILGKGKAWPLRAENTELTPDDYTYLRKFLDVTKANIFFAKGLLFVEGDAENILLPTIARLIGRPLEHYGVSIVKYDNSGSWKRFAKLFLQYDKDEAENEWLPTKISITRDLDLWPSCAEKNDANQYGFIEKKHPHPETSKGGNLEYWELDATQVERQISGRKDHHKKDGETSLERQNIQVFVSDRWTFEFCLAVFGLFEECYEALHGNTENIGNIEASDDEKATYIQSKVSKTDFAYKLCDILEKQLEKQISAEIEALGVEKEDATKISAAKTEARNKYSAALKAKLPPYIIKAIEHVTSAFSPKGDDNA